MDENEKKLLESLKNFDLSKLFMPNTYVDFEFKDLFPSYITSIESGDKYSIYIPTKNSNLYAPKNMLRFYGENDHFENNKLKNSLINIDLYHTEPTVHQMFCGLNHSISEPNVERSLQVPLFLCKPREAVAIQTRHNVNAFEHSPVKRLLKPSHLLVKSIKIHSLFLPC